MATGFSATPTERSTCLARPLNLIVVGQSPWQNGFAESFNSWFRDEFLNTELFTTVAEAQALADRWRWEYNNLRPHSALQGRTPRRQLNQLLHNHPISLRLDQ
jgi:transposase InsO family protein